MATPPTSRAPEARSRPTGGPGTPPAAEPTAAPRRPNRLRLPVPRGLRARLTATYTLAAAVLVVLGSVAFIVVLQSGLHQNLNGDLAARASTLAEVLQKGDDPGVLTQVGTPRARPLHGGLPDSIDAYRTPSGLLVTAGGAELPPLDLPPALVAATGPTRASVEVGRVEYRLAVTPVSRADGVWLAVAGASSATNDEAVHEVERGMLVAGPALVLAVALGTWLLGGAALRPVERMRRDASALGARPGSARLRVPETRDELAALATTLNELLERLQHSLNRQRTLVSDAGHELRTPLAVLRMELELADRPGRSREELAEAVSYAAVEADRLSQLADDLLFLARADEGERLVRPQPTDLAPVLASAARSFRTRADGASIELVVEMPETLPALADASAVRRALDNILGNALEHTRAGGRITLSAGWTAERALLVRVRDTGSGFPAEFLPHAFERFRRADAARRHGTGHAGTGLGLAIVAEVAAAHGGRARAGNPPGGGAEVELELPVREDG